MSVNDHQVRVEMFMEQAGQATPDRPTIPDEDTRRLRASLILEECIETIEALGFQLMPDGTLSAYGDCDLVEVADGCADISVVTMGTLSACGIDAHDLLEEVDRTNLAKFSEGGHRREDGKWIKPPDWQPPQIEKILLEQGWKSDE